MSKFHVPTFYAMREKAMRAAAEAMGLPKNTMPVVEMDQKSYELAAADVFAAFQAGNIDRNTVDAIISAQTGAGDGAVRPEFQRELAALLHKWLGRSVC